MPKTNLTLEDVEQIKQSKGKLSASEVQRKYSIGWDRLQKLWKDTPVAPTPTPLDPVTPQHVTKQALTLPALQENIQREIEHLTNQHKEIVVEDFFARLGQLEAKMERQTTQMERQTELMQNILDSLAAVSDIESDKILENKESHTLQDIGKSIQEYTEFTKTLVYCAITGFAVWQVLCKTWKHVDKGMSPVPAGPTAAGPTTAVPTAAAPTAPVPTKTGLRWFTKTPDPDPFEMK